ncbi:MAG: citrate synthase/methylcitrate synthase [Acidimicrobiaceae bacterium]|nr:citrate synthase/methylcitrate synthase [Acidimicrobiaceae bacterium]
MDLIDVPAGLNGVAVADTTIGTVLGDEGFYHYREYDAAALARAATFEDVWHLLDQGRLPDDMERRAFSAELATRRRLPGDLVPLIDAVASIGGAPLARLRSVLSAASGPLGLAPLLDLSESDRRDQAIAVAAVVPAILGALHRSASGLPMVEPDPSLGHAAAYLHQVTGTNPEPAHARALEQYLILTIDHGFNASTFTGRVVASTGADLADVACAAIGALAGPLHGGAPSRALDALDAIGTPERAPDWVRGEVAAGRRIMGFGHAVYRAPDPRSALLREVAGELGGELVERAIAIETEVLTTLAELKPDRPLPSNVEFYAGVIMETVGLPREMFTPTFAVSRTVGWVTHALEQAASGKLIRPAARYVGPAPRRDAAQVGPVPATDPVR